MIKTIKTPTTDVEAQEMPIQAGNDRMVKPGVT